jgi:hypothetical protein
MYIHTHAGTYAPNLKLHIFKYRDGSHGLRPLLSLRRFLTFWSEWCRKSSVHIQQAVKMTRHWEL